MGASTANPQFDIRKATPQEIRAEAERRNVLRGSHLSLDRRTAIPEIASVKARATLPDPFYGMNKTEKAYAQDLIARVLAHDLAAWRFEAVKLRLADATFYTPDFFELSLDGSIRFTEIKGHWEDDARVKIKVAAELYPYFTFRGLKRRPVSEGSGWVQEIFR